MSGTAYQPKDVYKLASDSTLYAQWKVDEVAAVSLKYDGNGATGGSTEGVTGKANQQVNIAANGFTRTGYTFAGWNTKADGSGTAYQPKDVYKLASDSVLYAQWKANEVAAVSLKYDGNGATGGSTEGVTGKANQQVNIAANGFTRTGYTFAGWNTKADGSGTTYQPKDVYKLASDSTLYAQWKADEVAAISLKYDGNGETGGSTEGVIGKANQQVSIAANGFTRTGYAFAGWNTKADGSGTAYQPQDVYKLASDSTLYAQWKAVPVLGNSGDSTPPSSTNPDQSKTPNISNPNVDTSTKGSNQQRVTFSTIPNGHVSNPPTGTRTNKFGMWIVGILVSAISIVFGFRIFLKKKCA